MFERMMQLSRSIAVAHNFCMFTFHNISTSYHLVIWSVFQLINIMTKDKRNIIVEYMSSTSDYPCALIS